MVLFLLLHLNILPWQVVNLFFSSKGAAAYGNRLDGIEKVKISAQKFESIEESLENEGAIAKATVELKGRLLNVIIVLEDDTTKDTAKIFPGKVVEQLTEKQNKYYDIQVFLQKKNEDDASFPIIAYKHHQKDGFSFTKDR